MEVVLSGERRGPPRGGASIEGGASGRVEGEVGPETCFLKLGTSDSKPWLQSRITLGAFTNDCSGMGQLWCTHTAIRTALNINHPQQH